MGENNNDPRVGFTAIRKSALNLPMWGGDLAEVPTCGNEERSEGIIHKQSHAIQSGFQSQIKFPVEIAHLY